MEDSVRLSGPGPSLPTPSPGLVSVVLSLYYIGLKVTFCSFGGRHGSVSGPSSHSPSFIVKDIGPVVVDEKPVKRNIKDLHQKERKEKFRFIRTVANQEERFSD